MHEVIFLVYCYIFRT